MMSFVSGIFFAGKRLGLFGPPLMMSLCWAAYTSAEIPVFELVSKAQRLDPSLQASVYQQQALMEESIAEAQLPDPALSLGFNNFPIENLDINQEAMTNIALGVTQVFPRGDTLALRSERLQLLGGQHQFVRIDRREKIAATVISLWLDYYRFDATIKLIEQDRALFEGLVDVAVLQQSSALQQSQQQLVLRAQTELSRLEDRLVMLQQNRREVLSQLNRWLWPEELVAADFAQNGIPLHIADTRLALVQELASQPDRLSQALLLHPTILAIDQRINASKTQIKLAEASYHPEWSINAKYGYRDDDSAGHNRADLFSIGVSVDLPLFTEQRQDRRLQAAKANTEAVKTDKAFALRGLRAEFTAALARFRGLSERQRLFDTRLLPEIEDEAEVTLAAYTNDTGDFAEAVRSRIAALDTTIELIKLRVERLQTYAKLNYFLIAMDEQAAGDWISRGFSQ